MRDGTATEQLPATKLRVPATWRVALACGLGAILGSSARRFLYRRLCGYLIASDVEFGVAYVQVAAAEFGPCSKIGSFTIVRNLEQLILGPSARIGTFNWIFGMLPSERYFADEPNRLSALVLEEEASLTSRHIVDATNKVTIGAYATVAGFRSQLLTHGIDVKTNIQSSAPISIGSYAMIGTGAILLKGAQVPSRSVVAAGSVFRETSAADPGLWSGVPAIKVRELDETGAYFTRTEGRVG